MLLKSFQGRFLVVATLLAASLLMMALYTKNLVRKDAHESKQLIVEYNKAKNFLKNINNQYLSLKSSIYQYALLLTPELKKETVRSINTLSRMSNKFKQGRIISLYPNIKKSADELGVALELLKVDTTKLLEMQNSSRTRYPAVSVLLDVMQPANRYFKDQLELARDEARDIPGVNGHRLSKKLDEIRYAWAKRVSEVRLFVANRSGTFGDQDKVLPGNVTSEGIYADRVDSLLNDARDIARSAERATVLTSAINEMISSSKRYGKGFRKAVSSFIGKDWRTDVGFLESKIEPQLNRNLRLLNAIEVGLSAQMEQRIHDSVETTEKVSSYIWWFISAVYILLLLAYFAFEKMIRQPLVEVAKALEAQANDEEYSMPCLRYSVTESDVLIDAFNNMKEQVNSRQLRLESILLNAGEGIVMSDQQGIIQTFNPAAEKLFNLCSEDVCGRHVSVLLTKNDRIKGQEWSSLWVDKGFSDSVPQEVKLVRSNDELFYISVKTSTMLHQGEKHYISVVMDVTETRVLTDRLQNLADMDSLTSLHNRRYFTEELDRLVERSIRRKNYSNALLFIDLDNFKFVNDTHGHHAGDRVLVEVSNILKAKVRRSDLLSRLGGDEFSIILYDVDEQQALEIASKYQYQIANFTFFEQGRVLDVGCTIGVAMMNEALKGRDEFIMQADFACQLAKRMGRNQVYLYSQEDNHSKDKMLGYMGVAQSIKDALRNDSFRLFMQPIKHTNRDSVFCYEVLLRMEGDKGELILPYGFMPSAERFDLMKQIDLWVINNSIKLLSEHQKKGSNIIFSINLSSQSIGDFSIANEIADTLSLYSVPPANLIFEITESVAISNMKKASHFLQFLRGLGCRTALDDFGAGYSSYAYLKDLPADFVKIDGAFVQNMDKDSLNLAMVKSMNEIAHIMGKQTIAEFVESEEVLKMLDDIGVDCVQGFYLGKPSESIGEQRPGMVIPIR